MASRSGILAACFLAASAADFYVDCDAGSDGNAGTSPSSPWASLSHAAAVIRGQQPLASDVIVHVLPSECYPRNSDGSLNFSIPVLSLGLGDSGTPTGRITYRAEGAVKLYGGAKLTPSAWTLLDASSNLWSYDLTSLAPYGFGSIGAGGLGQCVNNKAELFFNSTPMTLARYPNISPAGAWQWMTIGDVLTPTSFYTSDARPLRWVNESAPFLHGYWSFGWADNYVAVSSIVANKTGANLANSAATPVLYGYLNQAQFYGVNLRSELDVDTEYYVDEVSNTLFFIPPGGAAPSDADAFLSMIDSAVVLNSAAADGESTASLPIPRREPLEFAPVTRGRAVAPIYAPVATSGGPYVSYVTLDGFTVMYTRGTGVTASGVSYVQLLNLNSSNHGQSGLSLSGYNNSVVGVSVYNTGCAAVHVAGGDTGTLTPANNVLEGCTMSHYARFCRTYQPGINWYGVGNTFSNNLMQFAPHQGMLGGGNNNVFTGNMFADLCTEVTDSGAWYAGRSWVQRGSLLMNNTFIRINNTNPNPLGYPSVQAIYLDDELAEVTIVNNTFIDCFKGTFVGGGRDNYVAENTYIRCGYATHLDNRGMNWQADSCAYNATYNGSLVLDLFAVDYTQPPYSVQYPPIVTTLQNHPCVPVNNSFVNNVYCNVTSGFIDISGNASDWYSVVANNTEFFTC